MQFISRKKLIFIGCGLLVLGAAVFAAQWKWHFWHSTPAPVAEMPVDAEMPAIDTSVVDEAGVPAQSTGIIEIQSAYLFGQENVVKKPVAGEEVPKTQQPLELHGIVFIPNHPELAAALIAQAGGAASKYKTGEEISVLPGWKVVLISQDSVQIGNGDTVEKLELQRNAGNASPSGMSLGNQFSPPMEQNVDTTEAPEPVPETIEPSAEEAPPPLDESQPDLTQHNTLPPQGNMPAPQRSNMPAPQNPGQPNEPVPAQDLG